MLYLENYIKKNNHLRKVFGLPLMEMPTNFEQAKPIFQKLAIDLSPENLARDGEASRKEVNDSLKLLKGAWAELEAICERTVSEHEVF